MHIISNIADGAENSIQLFHGYLGNSPNYCPNYIGIGDDQENCRLRLIGITVFIIYKQVKCINIHKRLNTKYLYILFQQ